MIEKTNMNAHKIARTILNETLKIGDMTNMGKVTDIFPTQYEIDGSEYYHKSIISKTSIDKYNYEQIVKMLSKEQGKGNITLYHGADFKTYQKIEKSGKFGHSDGSITFLTKSHKEAIDYAKIKSKYRGTTGTKVLKITIPKWSVSRNTGSGEYETPFQFIKKGNKWIPDRNNVKEIYNSQISQ